MAKTDQEIIKSITERMSIRRARDAEKGLKRGDFTLSYAVSVRTGRCYVGYNLKEQKTTNFGSGCCAENRALYVANSYNERIGDLVFFALNDRSEFFNACSLCQNWIFNSRGFLKNKNQKWIISTTRPSGGVWKEWPLSNSEQEILFSAGEEKEISEDSRVYFEKLNF